MRAMIPSSFRINRGFDLGPFWATTGHTGNTESGVRYYDRLNGVGGRWVSFAFRGRFCCIGLDR